MSNINREVNIEDRLDFMPLEGSHFELLKGFSCGVHSIDAYFINIDEAYMDQELGLSSTTAYFVDGIPAGFVSACCKDIVVSEYEAKDLGVEDDLRVSALEITYLCVHQDLQYKEGVSPGFGLGRIIMENIMAEAALMQPIFGFRYIFVWSRPESIGFYKKFRFILLEQEKQGMRLMRFKMPKTIPSRNKYDDY
ncbi:GNAT family N-acetyltransferase [Bacillus sp. ET1]|nr:GNAT family N-acetyltransferase [Bacillus sp. ET1]